MRILVAEATENFGYTGAINAWPPDRFTGSARYCVHAGVAVMADTCDNKSRRSPSAGRDRSRSRRDGGPLGSPSGVSIYVTRQCLERSGFMDERYFLYFEELDWGYRAKNWRGSDTPRNLS
jgi:hypothetical protein